MTTTHLAVGKSGDKPKLPTLEYLPAAEKAFIVEVSWWYRREAYPANIQELLAPEHRGTNPAFEPKPGMRESRYCRSVEEVENFVAHCKKFTAVKRDGFVVQMLWEVYALSLKVNGQYVYPKENVS